ncbi:hypothetical protein TrRE_jg193, partial [Triparma retinervis]
MANQTANQIATSTSIPLRYKHPTLHITSSFWGELFTHKLNTLKLSEDIIAGEGHWDINGTGIVISGITPSPTSPPSPPPTVDPIMNTLTGFKSLPKNPLITHCHTLNSDVVLLVFLDQKKHKGVYWQGYPAAQEKSGADDVAAVDEVEVEVEAVGGEGGGMLGYLEDKKVIWGMPREGKEGRIYLVRSGGNFSDVSSGSVWSLRRLVHAVRVLGLCGLPSSPPVKFACFNNPAGTKQTLHVMSVRTERWKEGYEYDVVGWGYNPRLKIAPTTIDLKSQLDQSHLEREAANLNLRLMRWRVAPGLDLSG